MGLSVSDKLAFIREYKKQGGKGNYLSAIKQYAEGGELPLQEPSMLQAPELPEPNLTGMMKAKMALASEFGNLTARRMTQMDAKGYIFTGNEENGEPKGSQGNVYVSSYGQYVTPQIQETNGKLGFVNNPWSKSNRQQSREQSIKFERPQDAQYFGEHYKEIAPMMRQYEFGGETTPTQGIPYQAPTNQQVWQSTIPQQPVVQPTPGLTTYNKSTDTYTYPHSLEGPTITPKLKTGLLNEWGRNIALESKDAGLMNAMIGVPINAALSLPQMAVTKLFSGEAQRPSEAFGVENKYGKLATDIVLDPLNLLGIGLINKGKKLTNFAKYLTQGEAVTARGERMIEQQMIGKKPWVGQNNEEVLERFKNAGKTHEQDLTAGEYNEKYMDIKNPENLGINKYDKTFVYKDAPLTKANKARIAAHETGHFYKNTFEEGTAWNAPFDFSGLSTKSRNYLSGKGMRGRGTIMGDEIRERAAQLKDYIAQKNNIPLNKDFTITTAQLDDAIKNYIKDTGLDNDMSKLLSSLKDKKAFLNNMNKYALGTIGAGAGINQVNKD